MSKRRLSSDGTDQSPVKKFKSSHDDVLCDEGLWKTIDPYPANHLTTPQV